MDNLSNYLMNGMAKKDIKNLNKAITLCKINIPNSSSNTLSALASKLAKDEKIFSSFIEYTKRVLCQELIEPTKFTPVENQRFNDKYSKDKTVVTKYIKRAVEDLFELKNIDIAVFSGPFIRKYNESIEGILF